ncbi:hypothetical protein GCM10011506_38690 [Marivirga lumbricoides]|uniref:Metallophosphoesterase n=1 Tax=Marivirga lumbricoides TaxID=1046115 RepID=A0ABQ1N338_9BACT|nr:hypothetical protein GCM10011506_38690 [Marivirga lumbricoides]
MNNDRRSFIKKLGLGFGALPFLGSTLSHGSNASANTQHFILNISGRVISKGKGVKNVVVSDGVTLVKTNTDGEFKFASSTQQDFVFISIPAGYEIDRLANGSANFFKWINKRGKNNKLVFDLKPLEESDTNHSFLLLADPQIQNSYEAQQLLNVSTPDFIETIRELNTPNTFGIGCGDLVFDKLELFDSYNQSVQQMNIPFFEVIGNHDADLGNRSDATMSPTFKKQYGPTFYSFNRGEVHYVVLDDVFFIGDKHHYIGYIQEEQLAWLEQDLKFVEPGSTLVVSMHIPAVTGAIHRYPKDNHIASVLSNREHLYHLLAPFNTHIMSGHTHFNDNVVSDSRYEHCHGTVCGAWWSGPICHDGTPNGYGVYSAKGSELKWYYKATGHAKNHQFRVFGKNQHRSYPDLHSVNIWNWDKAWQAYWYEDGIRKGELIRITSCDPLSIKLHDGPDLPERRTWVDPQLTDHMFYFKPNEQAKKVEVEVIDRFGNIYREIV